jgi:hypothetical protein
VYGDDEAGAIQSRKLTILCKCHRVLAYQEPRGINSWDCRSFARFEKFRGYRRKMAYLGAVASHEQADRAQCEDVPNGEGSCVAVVFPEGGQGLAPRPVCLFGNADQLADLSLSEAHDPFRSVGYNESTSKPYMVSPGIGPSRSAISDRMLRGI